MNKSFCLVYTKLRKCLRNVTVAASELEKHFVVAPWPMLYKVQALWNEESTAVWEIETEWNPSLLPWLFVVVRRPYPSPHKQMVDSWDCQVYTDECVCVCACDTTIHRLLCACVTAHKIVRGNNMGEFIPIHRERLLENPLLSSTVAGVLYIFVSITGLVEGSESEGSWLDICERGCNTVTLPRCKVRRRESKRVSRPHCMSICPADGGLKLPLMP